MFCFLIFFDCFFFLVQTMIKGVDKEGVKEMSYKKVVGGAV